MGDGQVCDAVTDTANAIAQMEIRGAVAIADATAAALRDQATQSSAADAATLQAELRAAARRLHDTRPTAVSLPNTLRYVLNSMDGDTVEAVRTAVVSAVAEFRDRLDRAQTDLGAVGASRLSTGDTVMTHCHSTDVLACIVTAVNQGTELSAIVKETRPRKQGHMTARRLDELGVPVTFIVDSAAHSYLDETDHVFVGADTITADGSVVNKIGTAGLAASARERGVDVVVAAQTLKLDPETLSGGRVDIEHRDVGEVLSGELSQEFDSVDVANPAFDRTPARHVDAIVTERGQFPPESIVMLMRELYGPEPGRPWEA
ncbi:ribose 1,5-bisphosphate isomerase [Salinibaculum rarum]|uniref:ribose 1,5-bisphosphate isomerase n=1 Tax=Salinibaculum rarum TaxID=3058903 RepID=UPI00265F51AC|nr:ribose 1,5-bisphosphate isomerase [Salinibaculum sp. KK48]